jgi:hypothetical protein
MSEPYCRAPAELKNAFLSSAQRRVVCVIHGISKVYMMGDVKIPAIFALHCNGAPMKISIACCVGTS